MDPENIYAYMTRRVIPYGVSIDVTQRCNLRCAHCYVADTDVVGLAFDELVGLMDDLAALGSMELTLTGGEPLMRPDFSDILRHAVTSAGFSVKIFSNLTVLDEATADLLASLPLNRVETSILGPTAEVHDALTGIPGSFDAVIRGIKLLTDRGVHVTAKTVIMKPTRDLVLEMYTLALRLGITFRHDYGLFVRSDGSRRPLGLALNDADVERIKKRLNHNEPREPHGCNAGKAVLHIGADGSVYPCGPFPVAAGNIRETPLADIWYSSPLMRLVRSFSADDYSVCRECKYGVMCHGCMAMGMGLGRGRIHPCRFAKKYLRSMS